MLLLKQLQCLRMARSHPLWVDHPGAGQYPDQAWVGAGTVGIARCPMVTYTDSSSYSVGPSFVLAALCVVL